MFDITIFNKVSDKGLSRFDEANYKLRSEDLSSCDGIVLRSHKLHDVAMPDTVKAIARAGAGTNNIPIEACTEKGIVVFNTPGANANGVAELTLLSLLLASRKVYQGIAWAQTLSGEVGAQVEKGKKNYTGPEIAGKTLGVVGLGAIGIKVANLGIKMGMKVVGYDPYMSVKGALGLSWDVEYAESLDAVVGKADYLSVHIPLMEKTKGFINSDVIAKMKPGARLVNMSRGGLVDTQAVTEALESGQLSCYVTDFPDEKTIQSEKTICIPHLGASTPESEENCAVMAVDQLKDFLENGNIVNSVNFPACSLERVEGTKRITVASQGEAQKIGSCTTILDQHGIKIVDMINKTRGELAYNIIDVNDITDEAVAELKAVDGVIQVRVID